MRYIIIFLLLIFSINISLPVLAKTTKKLDGIMAIVNDDVITQSEFNQAYQLIEQQAAKTQTPMPKNVHKLVLNQLIDTKIQLQIVKQQGITVKAEEVKQAIANIAKNNHVSAQEVYQKVKEEGMSKEGYQARIKEQL